jgi:hypothetical protein
LRPRKQPEESRGADFKPGNGPLGGRDKLQASLRQDKDHEGGLA